MSRADQRALVLLVAGFVVWSAGFVGLYALQALGCAYGWPQHRLILVVGYVVSLVPLVGLALVPAMGESEPAASLSTAAAWANRAALAAGVLVFLPVTFASTCI
jgi:hypothetical protein